MRIHPFAETYPIDQKLVESMADDMRRNGFDRSHPIVFAHSDGDAPWDGMLVDGRTRDAAARLAPEAKPLYTSIPFNSDAEIVEYIRRANDQRRGSLPAVLRYMVALYQARYLGESTKHLDVAKAAGVPGVTALSIKKNVVGTPNEIEVWEGRKTLYDCEPPRVRKTRVRPPVTVTETGRTRTDQPNKANTPKPGKPEPTVEDLLGATKAKARASELVRHNRQLVEEVARLREQRAIFEHLTGRTPEPVARRELGRGIREATAYALLSDLHVETLVRPGDTPTGNAFTLAIADHRLGRFFSGLEWCCKFASGQAVSDDLLRDDTPTPTGPIKVRDLELWVGGDLFTNHLHPENVETAQLGPTKACAWVTDRLISGIDQLLASDCNFESIRIPFNDGNHGRTTRYMNAVTSPDHSWERTIINAVARHYHDVGEKRVRVYAPDSAHTFTKVYDFDLHFHHGHEVKYGGGVGGITIPMNKAVDAWSRALDCHYSFFGHWHQYIDLDRWAVNGSLIGFDGYAMSIKARPEPARQAFGLLDSKRGKCWNTPIWVEDRSAEIPLWERYETSRRLETGGVL